MDLTPDQRAALTAVLARAQASGFVGPGPLDPHIDHGLAFAAAVAPLSPGPSLDLGSGSGLPGLVLALALPPRPWVLLDANQRRGAALATAVDALELADRVEVVVGRAEEVAHQPRWRGGLTCVTARAFGPPAVVAECGAGFLALGGHLVVSEPPARPDRWPADGLSTLGLVPVTGPAGFQVCRQDHPCPPRFPRRTGVPAKRPLFPVG